MYKLSKSTNQYLSRVLFVSISDEQFSVRRSNGPDHTIYCHSRRRPNVFGDARLWFSKVYL